MKAFTRRRVLRGMLDGSAVTVALPMLNCFLNGNGTALASGWTAVETSTPGTYTVTVTTPLNDGGYGVVLFDKAGNAAPAGGPVSFAWGWPWACKARHGSGGWPRTPTGSMPWASTCSSSLD